MTSSIPRLKNLPQQFYTKPQQTHFLKKPALQLSLNQIQLQVTSDRFTGSSRLFIHRMLRQQSMQAIACENCERIAEAAQSIRDIEELEIRQKLGYVLAKGLFEEEVDRSELIGQISVRDRLLTRQLIEINRKYTYLIKKLSCIDLTVIPTATGFNLKTSSNFKHDQLLAQLSQKEQEIKLNQERTKAIEQQIEKMMVTLMSKVQENQFLKKEISRFGGQGVVRVRSPTFQVK